MELSGVCTQVLLGQIAELADILFWKYDCQSGLLEISGQTGAFISSCPSSALPLDKQESFNLYIGSIHPDDQQAFRDIVTGQNDSEEGCLHYRFLRQGETHYHKCRYNRQKENDNTVILGSIIDETCAVTTQQRLKEKETVFEHIAAYSNIGIFSWKPFSNEQYVSDKWYQNFGLSSRLSLTEAMRTWITRIHPEDLDKVKKASDELHKGKKKYMDVTFRLIQDNRIRWIRYSAILKNYDLPHNDIQVVGMNQDITDTKTEEERNTKIIEAIPDFIFIFDRNFYLRDIFKSPNVKLLHPQEELLNADGRNIYSPEVSQLFINSIRQCLEQKKMVEIEYPLDIPAGRYYFQARMVPFGDNHVMALIHDITEKMQQLQELIVARNKAEEADQMKSVFLANMSHEIRTPLNAIVGFSEILTDTEDPEEKKMYREIIRTNSELLLQLINDILDLSKIESGKTEIVLQPTDLNNLLEEAGRIYQLKMPKGVQLFIEIPKEKIWFQTDHNRVTQVLFNFLSNAVKNTRQGNITLRLAKAPREICFSVSDTGCGIPQEKLNIIFDRFIKINDFVQGTGLGLAICRTIADKLKGRIEVKSELGKGSTFSLFLPDDTKA